MCTERGCVSIHSYTYNFGWLFRFVFTAKLYMTLTTSLFVLAVCLCVCSAMNWPCLVASIACKHVNIGSLSVSRVVDGLEDFLCFLQ